MSDRELDEVIEAGTEEEIWEAIEMYIASPAQ